MNNAHDSSPNPKHHRVRVTVPNDIAKRAANFTGRLWVLEEVANWMDKRDERYALILGGPGSGKTALAAWLAGAGPTPPDKEPRQRLAGIRDAWDAIHFCVARGQRGSVNPNRFAQELASQFSERYDEYAKVVVQKIAPEINIVQTAQDLRGHMIGAQIEKIINNRQPEDLYDLVVRDPLSALADAAPNWRCFIMVDGLDEALTYPDEVTIVNLLAGSTDLPKAVRFLITCRSNERKVLDAFDSADLYQMNLSGQAQQSDIQHYVRGRISSEPVIRAAIPASLTPDAIAQELSTQAGGNFLYTEFLLDEISNGVRSLDDLSGLPHGLYGLYRTYLDRIVPKRTETQINASDIWRERYEPLLGVLSVAIPLAPRPLLPTWLGWDRTLARDRLADVSQVTECFGGQDDGCRLYHRSMAEFLALPRYEEKGNERENDYYTDPIQQHDRIIRYHLSRAAQEWQGDWTRGRWDAGEPSYPLRQLVSHMRARLDLAALVVPPMPHADIEGMARDLYELVLNPTFQEAQHKWADSVHTVLPDLRAALEVALTRDDLVPALRIIAAYRETIRSASVTATIFDAVDKRNFHFALECAEHYGPAPRPRGRWSRALHFYLAWEAAELGRVDDALAMATAAEDIVVQNDADELYEDLSNALLMRTAQLLSGDSGDVQGWLTRLSPAVNAPELLRRHTPPEPLNPLAVGQLEATLEGQINELEQLAAAGATEFVSGMMFLDRESRVERAVGLQANLVRLAGLPSSRNGIQRALSAALKNPYPRYRDVMLVALGIATAATPGTQNVGWVRDRLREILRAGLDAEGVTFTFDLPAILLEEARRRKIPARALQAYQDEALAHEDRWGTRMRAHSARAAALSWQQQKEQAFKELQTAGTMPSGFAGYATVTLLALANRCQEFGEPDRAAESIWGNNHDVNLLDGAMAMAYTVYDAEFREERVDLVKRYRTWAQQPAPDFAALKAELATIPDPDTRRVYKDLTSARWVAATTLNRDDLKALVVIAMVDSTLLDTTLGRLVGLRLREGTLSNEELTEAVSVCAEKFTTGRPWELGRWR